jgi:hypothetical protein
MLQTDQGCQTVECTFKKQPLKQKIVILLATSNLFVHISYLPQSHTNTISHLAATLHQMQLQIGQRAKLAARNVFSVSRDGLHAIGFFHDHLVIKMEQDLTFLQIPPFLGGHKRL